MNTFILSPSDFAFGFDQCKKCYFNKIVNKLVLRTGFPSVFSKTVNNELLILGVYVDDF